MKAEGVMAIEVPIDEFKQGRLLRLAQAFWELELLLPERVPEVMQGALAAGHDVPAVVEAAAMTLPNRREQGEAISRAFEQITHKQLTRKSAIDEFARYWTTGFLAAKSLDVQECQSRQLYALRQLNDIWHVLDVPGTGFGECMLYADMLDWDEPGRPQLEDILVWASGAAGEWLQENRSDV